jgi:hypothetical protein
MVINIIKIKKKILERIKQKVNCDYCGRSVRKGNIAKHQKTNVCKSAYKFIKDKYSSNKYYDDLQLK